VGRRPAKGLITENRHGGTNVPLSDPLTRS